MPNKQIEFLIKRLDEIHEKLEAHLIEGTGVRTNIEWLKRWMWVCIGASFTTAGTIATAILIYLLNK